MLHGPHHVGKALRGLFVHIQTHIGVALHDGVQDTGGDHQGLGRLGGVDEQVEGNGVQQAGGGEDTALPGVDAKQRHLPPLLGEDVDPQRPRQEQEGPLAIHIRAVDAHPFFVCHLHTVLEKDRSLLLGELPPKGVSGSEIAFFVHRRLLFPALGSWAGQRFVG